MNSILLAKIARMKQRTKLGKKFIAICFESLGEVLSVNLAEEGDLEVGTTCDLVDFLESRLGSTDLLGDSWKELMDEQFHAFDADSHRQTYQSELVASLGEKLVVGRSAEQTSSLRLDERRHEMI